ncbi:MAG: hypothetical protein RR398_02520, partial [Clostridia bacterium]
MDLPKRKKIRLEGYDYSSGGAYFMTICTYNRERILGDINVGQGLCSCRRPSKNPRSNARDPRNRARPI